VLSGRRAWLSCRRADLQIICVGLNYADHETNSQAGTGRISPSFRPRCEQTASDVAEGFSQVDEVELVVIGIGGRHITCQHSHVAGYTCGHDVSRLAERKPGGQWRCDVDSLSVWAVDCHQR
jgi:2-keto-4-pentenoate hydratase/2-oxohepta-3-ene-1,7-dioic acid hydratase in catechol pathway